jgi:uncharacterized protein (DUF1800 family)
VSDTVPVAQRIADLGQPLYGKPEPTGYPNVSAAWASAAGVMGRMNLAAALAAGQVPGVTIKTAPITAANPERALTALLGDWLSPRAVQSLTRAASEGKGESIAAILMASPDFQRR